VYEQLHINLSDFGALIMCDASEWSGECNCSAHSNRQANQERQRKVNKIVTDFAEAGLKIVRASDLSDGKEGQK